MCAACDWLMPLRELILWSLLVAKHNETVYMIGRDRKKVTVLKSHCLQGNPLENLLGYSVQNVNICSNQSIVCSESEEKTDSNLIKRVCSL